MTHTQTQGADGAGSYVDWDNLNRLFAQMPSGPWVVSRDTAGHEIRQIDTDPTNKHHWPFHLCRSIPGQRAACDDAVFDFIAGVLNAWPQISAERSEEAEIERILAMPEDDLRKRFLANGESPEQAATISRLCFDAASLRVALTRISEQYVTHRGDMTDAEALRAIKSIADAALAAKASTPAPAATPGVPDSVRARLQQAIDDFENEAADAHDMGERPDLWDEVVEVPISDVREVLKAISAQPAGQAGDAGIEATQITLGEGLVDITRIDHEGRTGVLFRPRKEHIAFGEPGELPEGTYWPVKGDVVLWVSGEGPGVAIKALADLAPNSTRTGAAETEGLPAVEDTIRRLETVRTNARHANKVWLANTAHYAAEWLRHHAARPEAPSGAGWSREDLEAFVAREWPEGRSAGAAARELVRALGVRGLAPTLQRLLTDLLGQINFASTDRAQILADFANAAPEAARMAKIDSFERWNPRVFDPTPPSDPAPSGQAEG